MPVIGTADAAVIRSNSHAIKDAYLNIVPLTVYAVGTINAAPGTYPAAEVYLSGSPTGWTSMRPQQVFRITDSSGSIVKMEAATRRIPDSGTIFYTPAFRDGDTGIAFEIAPTSIGSGDLITVYDAISPYAYFSRINEGTFYKRWDVTWEAAGSVTQFPQPVVNMGDHLHFRVQPGGTATWDMSGSLAFSWIGGSLDYLWFPPSGISLVSPSVDTDRDVTFEGTVGSYRMRLRARDNGISPDNNYRYIFITDGENVKAFNELFDVTAVDWETTTRLGAAFTMTVKATRGTDVLSYLYKGAPVLLTWTPEFSNTGWRTVQTTPDAIIDNFYGYIRRYELISTTPDGIDTYTVRVESPLMYFGDLPVAAQTLLAAGTANGGSATSWATVRNSLANVGYFTYYLLNFHGGALLSLSDYFPTDLGSFYRPALSSPAGDMLNAANKAVSLVTGANVGCTHNGAVWLKRHASYEADAWRNANGTAWTWTGDDILGDLQYDRDPIMKVSETEGAASISGTLTPITAYVARAGLFAGAQAVVRDNMDAFIALSTSDAGQRVGHQQALSNSPTPEIGFDVRGGHDFIEPALMEWYALDLAGYDPGATMNGGLFSNRALPLTVQRTWEFSPLGVMQRLSATFQPETKGKEAPERPQIVIGAGLQTDTIAACPTLNITWASTGATPAGWTGLTGTDQTNPQTYFGASYTTWDGTRAGSNTNWVSACIPEAFGVLYEFSAACTLTHMEVTFTWTGTPNNKRISFLGLVNGAWTTLDTVLYGTGVNNTGATYSWTGSAIVTKVIFGCATSSTSSVITMTVSKINSP